MSSAMTRERMMDYAALNDELVDLADRQVITKFLDENTTCSVRSIVAVFL